MRLFGRPRRSIKIAPGIRANLSRSGVSYTVGPRGASSNVGCLGIIGTILLAGVCSAFTGGSRGPSPYAIPSSNPAVADTVPLRGNRIESTEIFYVHGTLNVRSGPGKNYPTVRTLSRGDRVRLGPSDANGWAELFSRYGGSREGYVYRASKLVRSSPPPARTPSESSSSSRRTTSRSRSSAESRVYHRGPRGGCYTYTASGAKRYVDRSYCN